MILIEIQQKLCEAGFTLSSFEPVNPIGAVGPAKSNGRQVTAFRGGARHSVIQVDVWHDKDFLVNDAKLLVNHQRYEHKSNEPGIRKLVRRAIKMHRQSVERNFQEWRGPRPVEGGEPDGNK